MSATGEGPVRERVKRTPPLLEAHIDRFLEHVTSGDTRQEAARKVQEEWDARQAEDGSTERCHATASRFRRLYFADEGFRRRYEEALEDSGQSEDETGGKRKRLEALERERLVRRAFDEYIERALDPERGKRGSSNRALQNLLVLMHQTFKPFLEARVTRHVHSGAVGLFAQPVIDTSKWSLEEQREFVQLERRREALLEKARPEDGFAGDVVEGEVVELPQLMAGAAGSEAL